MPVTNKTPLSTFDCTGGTEYSFEWKFLEDEDLQVKYYPGDGTSTTLELNTDYSVTGAGVDTGGMVTTVTAYSAGTLQVRRVMDDVQEYDLQNHASNNMVRITDALDRCVMLIQQFKTDIDLGALIDASEQAAEAAASAAAASDDADDAETAKDAAEAAAASVNLPTLVAGDAGKILKVKADYTAGYETTAMPSTPDAVPTGAIFSLAHAVVPSGYKECNGDELDKTTYADLFAVLGTIYGETDGSGGVGTSHFRIPDIRGQFVRGWDHGAAVDPDRTTRTDRGDGTTGDNIGTKQADEFELHYHTTSGIGYADGSTSPTGTGQTVCGSHTSRNSDSKGGNETRPTNINMMYIIKY